MSLELVITYIMLGAYLFFTVETSIKMFVWSIKFDKYSRWQRHLYSHWSIFMAFIAIQLIWDANVYYFPSLNWDSPAHLNVQDISVMNLPLSGMVLWSMTTHRVIDWIRAARHLVPFSVIISICCIFREQMPWFVIVLYAYSACYCFYLLRLFIKNAHDYNIRLIQTYADTQYRTLTWMIHLIWLMAITLILYIYFAYVEMDKDYIYYGLVCVVWYYITWNIEHARETRVLEEAREEEEAELKKEAENKSQSTEESNERELARQSLRELTKQRLEDTLEEIINSRRLYLNPDLTVMDLAVELNSNRTYISQYFSEHHTTFLKYINDLRVEYAMFQIKNTQKKVTDIMFESGFRHSETFRRAFQNRYEVDPRDVPRKDNKAFIQ